MSIRRAIVDLTDLSGLNVTAFCREHGISTWLFYDLRRRFPPGTDPVLGSRAPHTVANRTLEAVEDEIIGVRKLLDEQGLDSGAWSIRDWLTPDDAGKVPSPSTIWRVLSRRGFITPEPKKRPKHVGRRFQAERANESWQFDDTTRPLADGTDVKVINVLDDCSRLNVTSLVVASCTTGTSFDALAAGAREFGWPERVQSDNAKEFIALGDQLAALGIKHVRSRPYHPETNGKVERFHQTQQRYLAAHGPFDTIEAMQACIDEFRRIYNWERRHRGIDRQIPGEVWTTTPKSSPADQPLGVRTEIFTSIVCGGQATVGRRYTIGLGYPHNRETATVVLTGLNCHVFIDGRLVRALTIDPTRRSQPRRWRNK